MSAPDEPKVAGPLRRMGAMVYDTLLIVAVLMVVSAIFLAASMGRLPESNFLLLVLYRVVLALAVFGFFGFFWTRKGCTLGMQVWKLRIETPSGALPGWRDVLWRLLAALIPWMPALVVLAAAIQLPMPSVTKTIGLALLGIGPLNYLAGYWTADHRAWHERFLRTRIVLRK